MFYFRQKIRLTALITPRITGPRRFGDVLLLQLQGKLLDVQPHHRHAYRR